MTVSILAGHLKEAIRKALKAVPKPSDQNNLKDMLTLEAGDGAMHVHVRNDTQAARVLASSSLDLGEDRLQVCVNAKNLEKLMTSFDDGATVLIEQTTGGLVLRVGRSKMVLPHLTEQQQLIFNQGSLSGLEVQDILSLDASVLAAALHAVEHAAARKDVRFVLCGVLFDFSRGHLRLRATNGIGMLTFDTSIPVAREHDQIILPIEFAEPLAALLAKEDGEAQLRLVKAPREDEVNALIVETATLSYRSQLVGGRFPAIQLAAERVTAFAKPVTVSTAAFRAALRRLSIIGSAVGQKGVGMQVTGGELRLHLNCDESVEYLPAIGADTDLSGFKADALLEILDRMTAPEIVLQLPATTSARDHLYFGEPDEEGRVLMGLHAQFVLSSKASTEKDKAPGESNVKQFPRKEEAAPKKAVA